MTLYAVRMGQMWLNFRRRHTGEFQLLPDCLTPYRATARRAAGYSGGEVVVFELQEVARYAPGFESPLPHMAVACG